MKKLILWAVKKFVTPEVIKNAIHAANARLAALEATSRITKASEYTDAAANVVAAYASAFANDGKMDEAELADVNAVCDATLDKYLPEGAIEAIFDAVLG